jgi:hypothetical protein
VPGIRRYWRSLPEAATVVVDNGSRDCEPRPFIGSEEQLLAFGLLAAGWQLVHADAPVGANAARRRGPRARQLCIRRRLRATDIRIPSPRPSVTIAVPP